MTVSQHAPSSKQQHHHSNTGAKGKYCILFLLFATSLVVIYSSSSSSPSSSSSSSSSSSTTSPLPTFAPITAIASPPPETSPPSPDRLSFIIVSHGYSSKNSLERAAEQRSVPSSYSKVFSFYNETFLQREKVIHDYTWITANRFCAQRERANKVVGKISDTRCSQIILSGKDQADEIAFASKVVNQLARNTNENNENDPKRNAEFLSKNEESIFLAAISTRRMIQGVSSAIQTVKQLNSALLSQSRYQWILYLATESMLVNPEVILDIISKYSSPLSKEPAASREVMKIFIGPEYRIGGAMLLRIPTWLILLSNEMPEKSIHSFFPFLPLASPSSSSLDNLILHGLVAGNNTSDRQMPSECLLQLISMDSTVTSSASSPSTSEPKAFQECVTILNVNYNASIDDRTTNGTKAAAVEVALDFETFSGVFQPFVINREGANKNEAEEARHEMFRDPFFAFSGTRAVASFGYCLDFRSGSIDACVVRLRVARNHFFDSTKEDRRDLPESATFLKLEAAAKKKAAEFAKLVEQVKNQSAQSTSDAPQAPLPTRDLAADALLHGEQHHDGAIETTLYEKPELVAPDADVEIDHMTTRLPPPLSTANSSANNTQLQDAGGAAPMTLSPEDARLADRTTGRNTKLRIAILTFASFNPIASKRSFNEELTLVFHKFGWINRKTYCDRWKYDYILENATELMRNDTRPLAWGKIKAVMKFLPLYDWVMWMDTDSLIMNYNVTVESILRHVWYQEKNFIIPKRIKEAEIRRSKRADMRRSIEADYSADEARKTEALKKWDAAVAEEDKLFENIPSMPVDFDADNMTSATSKLGDTDFVVARDWHGLNSGVFLLRNSNWSMKFLKRINRGLSQSVCPLPLSWWEQRVMMCLLDKKNSKTWAGRDERHVFFVDHQRMFNAYGFPTNENNEAAMYRKGDFVAHFPNCKAFKQCTFYFKQHWKEQFDANKQYYPESWLRDYRNGMYAQNYPLTWYPARYWNHVKYNKNTKPEMSHVVLYHGGYVDETDLADDYDGHYAFDNKGGEMFDVHKSVNRQRVRGKGDDAPATPAPPDYFATRKQQTGPRSELLDQLDAQQNFTILAKKSRMQKQQEMAEEARRKKKLEKNKNMNLGGDDGAIPQHDAGAVDQTIHFQSGSGAGNSAEKNPKRENAFKETKKNDENQNAGIGGEI